MGIYRFILAMAVLYSHVFGSIGGINPGVVAVISFFVISGYVMTLLIHSYYLDPFDLRGFYADRALRLFPQYLLYVFATLALWPVLGFDSTFLRSMEAWDIVANVLMLPLGYYMFIEDMSVYVPPARSLGLELTFYLVIPFFLLAPDHWGYRLLPGTFFIFATGSALAWKTSDAKYIVGGIFMLSLVLVVIAFQQPQKAWNREVWLGIAIGIPVVALLRQKRFSKIDEFFGNLSYGVFLNHFLVFWTLKPLGVSLPLGVPLGSTLLAIATYYACEHPAMILRRRLRRPASVNMAASPGAAAE